MDWVVFTLILSISFFFSASFNFLDKRQIKFAHRVEGERRRPLGCLYQVRASQTNTTYIEDKRVFAESYNERDSNTRRHQDVRVCHFAAHSRQEASTCFAAQGGTGFH